MFTLLGWLYSAFLNGVVSIIYWVIIIIFMLSGFIGLKYIFVGLFLAIVWWTTMIIGNEYNS